MCSAYTCSCELLFVCVFLCVCVTSRASTSCSPLEMLGMWMVVLKASNISISWRTSLRLVVPMISSLRPWERRRTSDFNVFIQSLICSYSSPAAFFLHQAHCSIKTFGKEKKNWQERTEEKLYAYVLCIQMKMGADGLWILYVLLKHRTLWDLAGFTVGDGSNKISQEAILIWGHVMCDECFRWITAQKCKRRHGALSRPNRLLSSQQSPVWFHLCGYYVWTMKPDVNTWPRCCFFFFFPFSL